MKFIKGFFKFIAYFFTIVIVIFVGGLLWTNFISVGPAAKSFCESWPVGATFDRSKAIRAVSEMTGEYIVRISFSNGEIEFFRSFAIIKEAGNSKQIDKTAVLDLPSHDSESFKITSTGFAKRSCQVEIIQGKVTSSKTWTWD
jgi:hypothetical protein